MSKKPKIKLSKKLIQEKYPVKKSLDVEVAKFAGRVFAIVGIFITIALSVDIYHFTH